MNELDAVVRAVREEFEPSHSDRERVKRRLLARAAGAGLLTSAAVTAKASAGASSLNTLLAGQSVGALAKLFFGSMLATFVSAGVFVAATRGLPGSLERKTPAAANTTPPASIRAAAPHAQSVPVDSSFAPPPPPPALGTTATLRPPGAPDSPAPPPVPSAVAEPAADLEAELQLLREVRVADANGHVARARQLLDELERRYPHGQLLQERSALRALTECENDHEATATARDFLRSYPRSVYEAKVRHVCRITGAPAESAPAEPSPAVRSFSVTNQDAPGH